MLTLAASRAPAADGLAQQQHEDRQRKGGDQDPGHHPTVARVDQPTWLRSNASPEQGAVATRSIVRPLLVALLGSALVAAAAPARASDTRIPITSKAQLANVSTSTSTYGNLPYGTTTVQGASLVRGEEVLVRRDSVVEHVDGCGPMGGFLKVTWTDGSRVSMRGGRDGALGSAVVFTYRVTLTRTC